MINKPFPLSDARRARNVAAIKAGAFDSFREPLNRPPKHRIDPLVLLATRFNRFMHSTKHPLSPEVTEQLRRQLPATEV